MMNKKQAKRISEELHRQGVPDAPVLAAVDHPHPPLGQDLLDAVSALEHSPSHLVDQIEGGSRGRTELHVRRMRLLAVGTGEFAE